METAKDISKQLFDRAVSALGGFDPISLKELDKVQLLNRVDTKFVFPVHKLWDILEELYAHYSILEIKGTRLNRYHSIYFDSPEKKLYLWHHNGRKKRYKMRYRKYLDSDLSFFEVKYKTNKGRTIKSRVRTEDVHQHFGEGALKLLNKLPYGIDPKNYQSIMDINFSRFTLADKNFIERATIDLQLEFADPDNVIQYNGIAIAELKQEKLDRSSFLMRTLKRHSILPMRISKYCTGAILLDEQLKNNRFKAKTTLITRLNKSRA